MGIMTSSFDDVFSYGEKYILSGLSLSRVVGLQASIAAVVKRAIEKLIYLSAPVRRSILGFKFNDNLMSVR